MHLSWHLGRNEEPKFRILIQENSAKLIFKYFHKCKLYYVENPAQFS